ncbi:alpha-1,6-glucosidase domain-containing protein [Undibacterium rugosum]|uniref:alpha-1,6-glucosidase domain-containing protein n=1 Tax=Undibacterium rugosum TaxID=2762291 RepID=UPI001B83406F|nr:alpha-1,6-glucosidase domain-containing protein [Undibacterium rugosum]MBR7779164.1 DUF3372 domain-containing protein [Undibacterium rugosum]
MLLLAASTSSGASTNATKSTPGLKDCDMRSHQAVLQISQLPQNDASAQWLSANLIHWSEQTTDTDAHFRLYYSNSARLHVAQDGSMQGEDGKLTLTPLTHSTTKPAQAQFQYLPAGLQFQLQQDSGHVQQLLRSQLIIVKEDAKGKVIGYTHLQHPAALDTLYAEAQQATLGVRLNALNGQSTGAHFALWAPTATQVAACIYKNGKAYASQLSPMHVDAALGIWHTVLKQNLSGHYYRYLVDVYVPGTGIVRNLVTDPYSISLNTDSQRSYIADLNAAHLKPAGWDQQQRPQRVKTATDMAIYELHVRDFSISDDSVPRRDRGKFLAFTHTNSNGMRHLKELSQAGLTDVHLLPVFDIATIPEKNCINPRINSKGADPKAQTLIAKIADRDCFNWGYDPYHYSAPEGSYASNPEDGAARIREFRQLVMALHQAGLRVGMDVVYNHTAYTGQHARSVLDRIVPGYYHRLNSSGKIEDSTCQPCGNTATEHMMMAKLMTDSVRLWAKQYQIDSFRFDLMGHQPRAVMEQLRDQLAADNGRAIQLIGEGWNFGEVANNQRFVQASQLSLNGSEIATFSDRARDALRGGGHGDTADSVRQRQGYINGLLDRPNSSMTQAYTQQEKMRAADMVRLGLAGSVASYRMQTADDTVRRLQDIDYNGQPAGYASQPGEVVNYVENHDNQTLFDLNVYKLPENSTPEDRMRVQVLGLGFTLLSQGIPYLHAGSEILRSKSMDSNSYNSGDWFNVLDWSYRSNGYGRGLPPAKDNQQFYPLLRSLLTNHTIQATQAAILSTKAAVLDLLKIRQSSSLFRLNDAAEISQRLRFFNTGSQQNPALIAMQLDGSHLPGEAYRRIIVIFNSAATAQSIQIPELKNLPLQLHPVHQNTVAGDRRIAQEARYDAASAAFYVPQRSISTLIELN